MLWLSIASVALGVAGLVYGWLKDRAKATLETLIRSELRGLAGNVVNIAKNPGWADDHFKKIQAAALDLESSEVTRRILIEAQAGARDATAAERMLGNLENELLSLQEGLFETRLITHPKVKASKHDGNEPDDGADGRHTASGEQE